MQQETASASILKTDIRQSLAAIEGEGQGHRQIKTHLQDPGTQYLSMSKVGPGEWRLFPFHTHAYYSNPT